MNKMPGHCVVCDVGPGNGHFIPKEYLNKKAIDLFVKSKKCWKCYNKQTKCNKLVIPKDCCYISFSEGKTKHKSVFQESICYTIRGEQMIFDIDKNDDIIGIELLSSKTCKKRCQE